MRERDLTTCRVIETRIPAIGTPNAFMSCWSIAAPAWTPRENRVDSRNCPVSSPSCCLFLKRLTDLHCKLVQAHADGRSLHGPRNRSLLGLSDFDRRLFARFIGGVHAGRRDLV